MPSRKRRKAAESFLKNNRVELVQGGNEYFDCLLQLIENARESIHLQTYIFSEDETGTEVAQALCRAAERKVNVHLVVDGYASQSLSSLFISRLKTSGVQFRFFEPLWRNKYYYFGRRLHHKLAVVDNRYALVG